MVDSLIKKVHKRNKEAVDNRFNEIDWNFPQSNRKDPIHNLHPYPAKFIPEIPRALIEILSPPKSSTIFDPFCGSGVTLVEAQRHGYESIGVDLNPIACLLSRVKTSKVPNNLSHTAQKILTAANDLLGQTSLPEIPNLDHWFKKEVQVEISALLESINQSRVTIRTKEALLLSLSSIIVRVSNQDSDTRYAAVKKTFKPGDVCLHFEKAISKLIASSNSNFNGYAAAKIVNKDILHVVPQEIGDNVGLVVTSPPYPNAYEYWLYHKYRMYWLGYDPIKVKKSEIGARAHYFKKDPPTVTDFKRQMSKVLDLAKQTSIDGAYICIVVGRSKVHGKIIDNAKLLIELAEEHNLEVVNNVIREIAAHRKSFNLSHANIKTENILIFQK